jgi:hypothetical protein
MVALERWGGVRMDEERSMGHEREREERDFSLFKNEES